MPDTASHVTISITVNGDVRTVPDGNTVATLLDHLGIGAQTPGIAVALGDAVVPRSRWVATPVETDAQVEIITATAGG